MEFSQEEFNEILNIFSEESEDILQNLTRSLIQLEKSPGNKQIIDIVFRNAHSLKGASRMIGFLNIQKLTHKIEDILSLVKEDRFLINQDILDILIKVIDFEKELIINSIKQKKEYISQDFNKYYNMLENILKKNELTLSYSNSDENNPKEGLTNNKDIKEIELESWQQVSQILTKINDFINDPTVINNSDKLAYFVNILKSANELFTQINFEEEKKLIQQYLEEFCFIQKASNFLCESDIENIYKLFGKLNSLILEKAKDADVKFITFTSVNHSIQEIENMITALDSLNENFSNLNILITSIEKMLQNDSNIEFEPILNKIRIIFLNIQSSNTMPAQDLIDVIKQTLNILKESTTNINDYSLIYQRLDIVNQMIELGRKENPLVDEHNISPISTNSFQKTDEFFVNYENSSFKTLRVDTHKLDILINQMSELIATRIKSKSQIKSLSHIQDNFEVWHNYALKSLKYVKYYEKKIEKAKSTEDISSILSFVSQLFNIFRDNAKHIVNIGSNLNHLQRKIQDCDLKLNAITLEMSEMIKNIRVLPISSILHTFPKMVRDLAHEKNKEIELFIRGSEIEVDKKIIEEIKVPLIHIIRNSIDHGIESVQKRLEAGKPKCGKIFISAKNINNKLVIEVQDDGQGVDVSRICEIALNKGLLTYDEVRTMTDEQIMNIIFWPGFSTNEKVTDISGRGIGLDVVQTKINKLNGKVNITSVISKGSKVTIEIPTSRATINALIFKVCGQYFAIALNVVKFVKFIKHANVNSQGQYPSILLGNESIALFDLSKLLQIEKVNKKFKNNKSRPIIIIESDGTKIGLLVDKILEDQEIVNKQFKLPIVKLNNISGIASLASGDICLVLNAVELIKTAFLSSEKSLCSDLNNLIIKPKRLMKTNKIKSVLLIDDSTTIRNVIKNMLSFSNLLNVYTARSPDEAIKVLSLYPIDLIITDFEMPNKNADEFVEYLKDSEGLKNIPIIVLTTKYEDKIKKRMKELGVDYFYEKMSFIKENLISKIMVMIDES